jgi:hypothetical protein
VKPIKFESSSGALQALLDTRSFVFAHLYTFTLKSGPVLRYAAADIDIGYGGNVWSHGGPQFDNAGTRSTGHWKVGLDTDTWSCVISPRATDPITGAPNPDLIGSVPWLSAVRGGALDGAVVQVDRAHFAAWPSLPQVGPAVPAGVVNIFTGRVAATDIGRTAAIVNLNSHLELLDVQMPIHLYQAGCHHNLFDNGCTLSAAAYGISGTAAAGSTRTVIISTVGTPSGSGTYALGRIAMTSGANAGFARSVRSWTPPAGGAGGLFTLLSPFPFTIADGDDLVAYPGCNKQLATCELFGNQANFGGQPFIPPPETSV